MRKEHRSLSIVARYTESNSVQALSEYRRFLLTSLQYLLQLKARLLLFASFALSQSLSQSQSLEQLNSSRTLVSVTFASAVLLQYQACFSCVARLIENLNGRDERTTTKQVVLESSLVSVLSHHIINIRDFYRDKIHNDIVDVEILRDQI